MTLTTITFDADEWQLVPKVLTKEMIEEVSKAMDFGYRYGTMRTMLIEDYAALLSAAPQPPAQDEWNTIKTIPRDKTVIVKTNDGREYTELMGCAKITNEIAWKPLAQDEKDK